MTPEEYAEQLYQMRLKSLADGVDIGDALRLSWAWYNETITERNREQ